MPNNTDVVARRRKKHQRPQGRNAPPQPQPSPPPCTETPRPPPSPALRVQRARHNDNIQRVSEYIDKNFPYGTVAYDNAITNMFDVYGREQWREMEQGRPIEPLSEDALRSLVDRLCNTPVQKRSTPPLT